MGRDLDVRAHIGRTVIVNLLAVIPGPGESFRGVLATAGRDSLTLEHVELIRDDRPEPVPLDGAVLVPAVRVDWVQVV